MMSNLTQPVVVLLSQSRCSNGVNSYLMRDSKGQTETDSGGLGGVSAGYSTLIKVGERGLISWSMNVYDEMIQSDRKGEFDRY